MALLNFFKVCEFAFLIIVLGKCSVLRDFIAVFQFR